MNNPALTKAISLQALTGSERYRRLRLPDFKTIGRLSALRTDRLHQQGTFLALMSVRGCVKPSAIVRQEGIIQRTIKMTTSGIEPATFRLVAQCLNQLRHSEHLVLIF